MAWFVDYVNPWFKRGARFLPGLGAGVFDFDRDNGYEWDGNSFRVVLVITMIHW